MVYVDTCTHGGPPMDVVVPALETLEAFQTRVMEAKLFDLPPGTEHFRDEQRDADLLMLLKMVQKQEYEKLRTARFASLFLAEAVDCRQRSEAIALAWFCTAFLLSAAAKGVLQDAEEVPHVIREHVKEADKSLATCLWRWTPCDCISPGPQQRPWVAIKTSAAQFVKSKDWVNAIKCYDNALSILSEIEESELAPLAMVCFDSRSPTDLHEVQCERARIYSNISLCHLSCGRADNALEASLAAAKADPAFAKAYGRKCLALEALGQSEEAFEAAQDAVRCAEEAGQDASEYLAMCTLLIPIQLPSAEDTPAGQAILT